MLFATNVQKARAHEGIYVFSTDFHAYELPDFSFSIIHHGDEVG
jgi:hypothetical protein